MDIEDRDTATRDKNGNIKVSDKDGDIGVNDEDGDITASDKDRDSLMSDTSSWREIELIRRPSTAVPGECEPRSQKWFGHGVLDTALGW